MNDRPHRPSFLPIALLMLLILVGTVAIFAYATIKPLVAMTGQVVPRLTTSATSSGSAAPATSAVSSGTTTQNASAGLATPAGPAPAVTAPPGPTATPFVLPSLQRKQRVTFLLLGSDTDLKFAPGQYLTQSMILVTVDPVSHTVGMLSIPRDLWVQIPGYGYGKIQIAYEIGGIALARATVEQNFGVPIDYYAWVGLQGFQKLIDTAGGINLDLAHPVLDDAYPDDLNPTEPYAYKRLYLPAGPQHLDGEQALEFVRSRHGDLIGDFGRSSRQQLLLLALKQRLTGTAIVFHLPQLVSDLQDSVRTDVPISDLLPYASFAKDLQQSDIHQVVLLPPTYSSNATTPDGSQDIVVPNWSAIDQEVAQMFQVQPRPAYGTRAAPHVAQVGQAVAPTPTRAPIVRPTVGSDTLVRATATPEVRLAPTPVPTPGVATVQPVVVQVENGTTVPGLAERATQYLESSGYRLAAPVNAPRAGAVRTTVTFYAPTARDAAFRVAGMLGATVVAGNRAEGAGPTVVVVLGSDDAKRF